MRKPAFPLAIILSLSLFSLTASAAYTLPSSIYTVENGDTVIGPIKIVDDPGYSQNYAVPSEFMAEWAASPRNFCGLFVDRTGAGGLKFFIVPDGVEFTFKRESYGLSIKCDKLVRIIYANVGFNKYGIPYPVYLNQVYVGPPNNVSLGDCLTSTYLDNNLDAMQDPTGWVDYTGNLRFTDDKGIFNPTEPEEPEPPCEPGSLAPALPEYIYTIEEGDTVIGELPTFPSMTEDQKAFLKEWQLSPRNYCGLFPYGDGSYGMMRFAILPEGKNYYFQEKVYGQKILSIDSDEQIRVPYIEFEYAESRNGWVLSSAPLQEEWLGYAKEMFGLNKSLGYPVTSTFLDNNPGLLSDCYKVKHTGNVRFTDAAHFFDPESGSDGSSSGSDSSSPDFDGSSSGSDSSSSDSDGSSSGSGGSSSSSNGSSSGSDGSSSGSGGSSSSSNGSSSGSGGSSSGSDGSSSSSGGSSSGSSGSSSSSGTSPPDEPPIPDIPINSGYLGFDSEYLYGMARGTRSNIGNIATVALSVFVLVLGIYLVFEFISKLGQ